VYFEQVYLLFFCVTEWAEEQQPVLFFSLCYSSHPCKPHLYLFVVCFISNLYFLKLPYPKFLLFKINVHKSYFIRHTVTVNTYYSKLNAIQIVKYFMTMTMTCPNTCEQVVESLPATSSQSWE